MTYFLIGLGSAIGGMLRFWLANLIEAAAGSLLPWGTLAINISGSAVIGLFAALTGPGGRYHVPVEWRQFVMVGICGGYTTFSAFSLQTLGLAQGGQWALAATYVVASVMLCLAGVWLGSMGGMLLAR